MMYSVLGVRMHTSEQLSVIAPVSRVPRLPSDR